MKALLVAGITLVFASFAAAQAESVIADVASTQGEVLVNKGEDYVAPSENSPLMEGDQVLTKAGASAVVHYEDGCDVTVPENTVYTVETPEDCAAAIMAVGEAAAVGSAVPFIITGVGTIGLIALFSDKDGDGNDGVVVSP